MGGSNRASSSIWLENQTYQYYLPLSTATSGWSVNASLKKYFGLRAFVVELQGSWMENEMQEYLQGELVNYHSARLHTQLNLASNPVWWFSTDITGSYDRDFVTGSSKQQTQMVQIDGE